MKTYRSARTRSAINPNMNVVRRYTAAARFAGEQPTGQVYARPLSVSTRRAHYRHSSRAMSINGLSDTPTMWIFATDE